MRYRGQRRRTSTDPIFEKKGKKLDKHGSHVQSRGITKNRKSGKRWADAARDWWSKQS